MWATPPHPQQPAAQEIRFPSGELVRQLLDTEQPANWAQTPASVRRCPDLLSLPFTTGVTTEPVRDPAEP